MPQSRSVPSPEKVTWADRYRLGLVGLMVALGITILIRSISAGILTLPAILVSAAFVAFGVYRLYVGIVRYRQFISQHRKGRDSA
jgi:hypothetical protein